MPFGTRLDAKGVQYPAFWHQDIKQIEKLRSKEGCQKNIEIRRPSACVKIPSSCGVLRQEKRKKRNLDFLWKGLLNNCFFEVLTYPFGYLGLVPTLSSLAANWRVLLRVRLLFMISFESLEGSAKSAGLTNPSRGITSPFYESPRRAVLRGVSLREAWQTKTVRGSRLERPGRPKTLGESRLERFGRPKPSGGLV